MDPVLFTLHAVQDDMVAEVRSLSVRINEEFKSCQAYLSSYTDDVYIYHMDSNSSYSDMHEKR